jgi:hypothetical protein
MLAKKNSQALSHLIDVIAEREDTDDANACAHIEEILVDARMEDDILRYSESLRPRHTTDEELVIWADFYSARRLIALRMAQIWREWKCEKSQPLNLSKVEAKVIAGISLNDLKLKVVRHILSIVFDEKEIPLEETDFDVVVGDAEMEESFALTTSIYRGFLRFGDHCGFQPITAIAHAEHLINSLLTQYDTEQAAESPFDLLKDPFELLEPFISGSSRGFLGTDVRKARMLINAFKICCRIGSAHKILNDDDVANAETELERLSGVLESFND